MLTKALHEVQGLGEPSPDATITSYQVGLLEYVGILFFPLCIQITFSVRLITVYEAVTMWVFFQFFPKNSLVVKL